MVPIADDENALVATFVPELESRNANLCDTNENRPSNLATVTTSFAMFERYLALTLNIIQSEIKSQQMKEKNYYKKRKKEQKKKPN